MNDTEINECESCGSEIEANVNGTMCAECQSHCHSCQGTGIGYPVDYNCSSCGGRGYNPNNVDFIEEDY